MIQFNFFDFNSTFSNNHRTVNKLFCQILNFSLDQANFSISGRICYKLNYNQKQIFAKTDKFC